ncbi:MAG: DUF2891 domain-containing protein [Chloroflexota bacterium]
MATNQLTIEQASHFARLALDGISREYPNAPGVVLNGPGEFRSPRELHPAFYGCFDWHSAVHSHWMLVRLLRLFPDMPEAAEIRRDVGANLSPENIQAENAYLQQPNRRSFERTYGWAWLLKLAEELHGWDDADGRQWRANLEPLAETFVQRYLDFLPKQTYPIRGGTHPNTAFGLTFALDYARTVGRSDLRSLIVSRSRDYFGSDEGYPAAWEPSGNDFLSPSLIEADLMRRVLPADGFAEWFGRFLPDLAEGKPETLLQPATVADRTDPQIVHLDGLNLSRAWCMQGVAEALPEGHSLGPVLLEAAERHAAASLPHVASGDYMGEHWLASFAVYMLSS